MNVRKSGVAASVLLGLLWTSSPGNAASPAKMSGTLAGYIRDTAGIPQMGATVVISSSQLLDNMAFQLLTNDRGRFSSASLPPGIYSVKVTLAGFLPADEQDIQVRDEHTTLLEIVLGSVFASLEKLRRQPDQQVAADDWSSTRRE